MKGALAPLPGALRWLLQAAPAVPAGDGWLAPGERALQAGLHLAPRRAQWRLGRYAAKVALARELGLAFDGFARLELRAAADGAPEPWADGARLAWALSLSHCGALGLVALARAPIALGADLERVAERSAAFVGDYLSNAEQQWVAEAAASARAERVTLLWSAKESALKALRTGLRRATRSVELLLPVVSAPPPQPLATPWAPLAMRDHEGGRTLAGCWCRLGEHVLTLLADPWPARGPLEL